MANFILVIKRYSDGLGSQVDFITTTTDTIRSADDKHSKPMC
jgi:hypothetical protein